MELLTTRDVAKLCQISGRQIYKLLEVGRFPVPLRIGRSVRWPRETIERWIADGCPPCDDGSSEGRAGQ